MYSPTPLGSGERPFKRVPSFWTFTRSFLMLLHWTWTSTTSWWKDWITSPTPHFSNQTTGNQLRLREQCGVDNYEMLVNCDATIALWDAIRIVTDSICTDCCWGAVKPEVPTTPPELICHCTIPAFDLKFSVLVRSTTVIWMRPVCHSITSSNRISNKNMYFLLLLWC